MSGYCVLQRTSLHLKVPSEAVDECLLVVARIPVTPPPATATATATVVVGRQRGRRILPTSSTTATDSLL